MSHAPNWAMARPSNALSRPNNTRLFDLDYRPFVGASLGMVLITIVLVTLVGMLASVSILRSKPIQFLREQTEEE